MMLQIHTKCLKSCCAQEKCSHINILKCSENCTIHTAQSSKCNVLEGDKAALFYENHKLQGGVKTASISALSTQHPLFILQYLMSTPYSPYPLSVTIPSYLASQPSPGYGQCSSPTSKTEIAGLNSLSGAITS